MKNKLSPLVLLAGGLGTRLHPVTQKIPKSLVQIADKPFILYQLALLKKQGIKDIVMCIGHLGEMIQDFIGNGARFDLHIQYSHDGDQQLGTAGAIKKALPLLGESFFVMYGDSYLTCDYTAVQTAFIEQKKIAMMTVFHNKNQWDQSNVIFNNNTLINYDKKNHSPEMQHIDYGLNLFHQAAFNEVPKNETYDLSTLQKILLSKNQLAGFEVKERFYEVGSLKGIENFEQYIKIDSSKNGSS